MGRRGASRRSSGMHSCTLALLGIQVRRVPHTLVTQGKTYKRMAQHGRFGRPRSLQVAVDSGHFVRPYSKRVGHGFDPHLRPTHLFLGIKSEVRNAFPNVLFKSVYYGRRGLRPISFGNGQNRNKGSSLHNRCPGGRTAAWTNGKGQK